MRTQAKVTLRRTKIVGYLVLIALGLWILPARAAAAESATETKKSAPKKTAKQTTHRKSSSRHTSRRRSNYRYRLARLQPEPDRIQEIQQALIREGYLKQEPTGKWDDSTREAMRRYQEANGFPATGLPEAKTLMKLGLGPHPLPEEADPNVSARPSIGATTKPDSPVHPNRNTGSHPNAAPNEKQ